MRITKVYTRGGDGGETGLGGGQRVAKDSARIAAVGDVDELNSALGVVIASAPTEQTAVVLRRVQNELFRAGADLCLLAEDRNRPGVPLVEERHIDGLERDIDRLQAGLRPLEEFVLPGGTAASAQLHVARGVCRRAERTVVGLAREEAVGERVVPYLNRLSDLLFVMARHENVSRGTPEPQWDPEV